MDCQSIKPFVHQLRCVKSTELFIVSQTIQTLDMAEYDLQQENVNTVKSFVHTGLYWNNLLENECFGYFFFTVTLSTSFRNSSLLFD